MKQKIMFFFGIIILLAVVGGVVGLLRSRTPKQGELKVESQPSASVFLDDKHIGRTPVGKTSYKVDAGEYTVKIVPDAGVNSYATFQDKIKISPNTLTYIDVNLAESELTSSSYILWLEKMTGKKGELAVVTTPDTATILLDDEPKGTTPITVPDISSGEHTLTIVSRGFITRTIKIKVSQGYRLMASVKLALDPGRTVLGDSTASPSAEASPSASPKLTPTDSPKTTPTPTKAGISTDVKKPYVLIKDTPTGFLNVRLAADKTASKSGEVKPGEKHSYVGEEKDKSGTIWYQITTSSTSKGWVTSQYAEKVE